MLAVLFATICQAVAGAPAPPPAAAPPAVEAPPAPDAEQQARLREIKERQKLVCRKEVVLGSRMPTKRCTSQAEDAAESANSRAWLDRVQSQIPTKE